MSFESRYAEVAPGLASFCRMLARDEGEAADLFQETWSRALERQAEYRKDRSLPGWLCAIARNLWTDRKRRQAREARALSLRKPPEPGPGGKVLEALSALPEDERQAIHLYYFQKLSLKETGDALGASVWQVRERLASAYEALAGILEIP